MIKKLKDDSGCISAVGILLKSTNREQKNTHFKIHISAKFKKKENINLELQKMFFTIKLPTFLKDSFLEIRKACVRGKIF